MVKGLRAYACACACAVTGTANRTRTETNVEIEMCHFHSRLLSELAKRDHSHAHPTSNVTATERHRLLKPRSYLHTLARHKNVLISHTFTYVQSMTTKRNDPCGKYKVVDVSHF